MLSSRLGNPPPPPPTVVKEGYLLRAPTGLLAKIGLQGWERRYFQFYLVGSTPFLECFKCEQDVHAPFSKRRSVSRTQLNTITSVITKIIDAKQKNEFSLILKDQQIDLAARTRAEKQAWSTTLIKTLSELGCLKGFEDNVYEEHKPMSRLDQVSQRQRTVDGSDESPAPSPPPQRRPATASQAFYQAFPPVRGSLRPASACEGAAAAAASSSGSCPTATFDDDDLEVPPPPLPNRATSCRGGGSRGGSPVVAEGPRRKTYTGGKPSKSSERLEPGPTVFPRRPIGDVVTYTEVIVDNNPDLRPPSGMAPPPPSAERDDSKPKPSAVSYTEVMTFDRPPPLPPLPPEDTMRGGSNSPPNFRKPSAEPIHDSVPWSLRKRLIQQREDNAQRHAEAQVGAAASLAESDNDAEAPRCGLQAAVGESPHGKGLFITNSHFQMDSDSEDCPPELPLKSATLLLELERRADLHPQQPEQSERTEECRQEEEECCSAAEGPVAEDVDEAATGASLSDHVFERKDSGCPRSATINSGGEPRLSVGLAAAYELAPQGITGTGEDAEETEAQEDDVAPSSVEASPSTTAERTGAKTEEKAVPLESHDSQDSGIESPFNSNKMPSSTSTEALQTTEPHQTTELHQTTEAHQTTEVLQIVDTVKTDDEVAVVPKTATTVYSEAEPMMPSVASKSSLGRGPSCREPNIPPPPLCASSSSAKNFQAQDQSSAGGKMKASESAPAFSSSPFGRPSPDRPCANAAQVQMRRKHSGMLDGSPGGSNRSSNRSSLVITCANGVRISAMSDCEGDDEEEDQASDRGSNDYTGGPRGAWGGEQPRRGPAVEYANVNPGASAHSRVDYVNSAFKPSVAHEWSLGACAGEKKPMPMPRHTASARHPAEDYMPAAAVEARERGRLTHRRTANGDSPPSSRQYRQSSLDVPDGGSPRPARASDPIGDRRCAPPSSDPQYQRLADMRTGSTRVNIPLHPPQEGVDVPRYPSPISPEGADQSTVPEGDSYRLVPRGGTGTTGPAHTSTPRKPVQYSSLRTTFSGAASTTIGGGPYGASGTSSQGDSPLLTGPAQVQRRPKKASRRELRSKHVSTPAAVDTLDARSSPYKPLHGGTLHPDGVTHRLPAKRSSFPVSIPLRQKQTEELNQQMSHRSGVQVSMWKQDALANVAFVDVMGCAWVAGWRQAESPLLQTFLHVGDQVVSLNGEPVATTAKLVKRIKKAGTGAKLCFVVRRTPHARVFNIQREGNTPVGVTCTDSAEIVKVHCGGLASTHGLQPKTITMSGNALCNWVFTEINHKPLSLFCDGAEVQRRLGAVGEDLSIMVQPKDFVDALKKQLTKTVKRYKSYVMP